VAFPLLAELVTSGFLLWSIWLARRMLINELTGTEVKLDEAACPPFLEVGIRRVASPNVRWIVQE
jgi:hypothetical protein